MEVLEIQILKSADFEPHNAMSNLYHPSAAKAVHSACEYAGTMNHGILSYWGNTAIMRYRN